MWHTAEMVKIFEKMTEGYGYDIYQNRKLCVALCNDLFADYSVEKNIMQMLFRAGLGEATLIYLRWKQNCICPLMHRL